MRLVVLMVAVSLLVAVPAASSTPSSASLGAVLTATKPMPATPQLLDQALANGEITAEQRLLYLAYAIYEYSSLPARFRSDVGWSGTATVRELRVAWQAAAQKQLTLSPATYNELNRLLSPAAAIICDQEDGPNDDSTSVNFFINYDTISGGLTLADYRNTLDAAYATEVTSYDWARPPVCPEDTGGGCTSLGDRYPVQIAPLGGGLYGYVTTGGGDYAGHVVGDNPNTAAVETDSTTSCMVLRDDSYVSLGGLVGLRVTSAHEFVHAIQDGYGDPDWDEDLIWWEGHAAYTEDEVWDAIDDNYQYLWPDWTQCLGEWPTGAPSYPEYSTWILFRYAAEHNGGVNVAGGGEDVAQGLWANIAAGQHGLVAFDNALGAKTPGATLADTFHQYAIASRFMKSCPDSNPYCYEEADGYVTYVGWAPGDDGSVAAVGDSYTGSIRDNYAINWVGLPTSGGPYNVTLSNTSAGGQLRASIVADPTGDRTGTLDVEGLPTVVNTGESRSLCYTPPGAPDSVVVVITNQSQTAANPASCTSRSYNVAVTAASNTGSLTNLPVGATVDIGCGVYVKVKRNSGDPGTVTAIKHAVAPGGNPPGAGEMPLWWNITATGGAYNVDLTLCYTDAELAAAGAGVTESGLVLFRNTGGPTWTEVGADARDTGVNCVTKNGVTAFSNWTLGMPGQPNAITLRGFAARSSGTSISLAALISIGLLGLVLVVRKGRR
jgi:hypothetical protein